MKQQRDLNRTVACAFSVLAMTAVPTFAQDPANSTASTTEQRDRFFDGLDANHDGFLSKSELRQRPDYLKAFNEADENHDGKLDRSEFVKAESLYEMQKVGKYVDDSVVTAKVKTALLRHMKTASIGVETYHGHVLLSGFVDNEQQMNTAVKVASSVGGVVTVKNSIALKE